MNDYWWLHTVSRFSVELWSMHGVVVDTGYLHKVLANRFTVKNGVERRHFVHPHGLHFEQLRHIVHNDDACLSLVLSPAKVGERDDGRLHVLWWVMRDDFRVIGAMVLRCELERNPRIVMWVFPVHKESIRAPR
jgi:hypothetical protein